MIASIIFGPSVRHGTCSLCQNLMEHPVMKITIHTYEIRTCEKCFHSVLQSLQGLTVRLENISKKIPIPHDHS